MDLEIIGVHNYKASDKTKDFISKKFEKIQKHVKDDATKAIMSIELVRDREFLIKSNIHMKWGKEIHIEQHGTDLYDTIEGMMKTLDENIVQEKKKHHRH